MTLRELKNTLEQRKKGLAYKIWKQAYLSGIAFGGKYPDTPQKASPDLYPPEPTIKRPDWLK